MDSIEQIINESYFKIKEILLKEAKNVKDFPKSFFGIENAKYSDKKPIICKGLLEKVDLTCRGISVEKPAILLYDPDKFWTENSFVYLLPDGIYNFKENLFLETENKKPTGLVTGFPDFATKQESVLDYFKYGKTAISKLQKLEKKSKEGLKPEEPVGSAKALDVLAKMQGNYKDKGIPKEDARNALFSARGIFIEGMTYEFLMRRLTSFKAISIKDNKIYLNNGF